jgi:hypothetical protein
MGIDIYLFWEGMTEQDKERQYDESNGTSGQAGYLREGYGGGPYATKVFVREAFNDNDCQAKIPASIMRERLSDVISLYRSIYNEEIYADDPDVQPYVHFVELAERKERETGQMCTIVASY